MIAARNLFSAHLCPGSSWTKETLDIPLETDEMIIDYLSRFDGDADKAYFSLMVELGSGKGIIIIKCIVLYCIIILCSRYYY